MSDEATTTDLEETRGVPIEIGGKTRHLILDFNALALIEEKTGLNMLFFSKWRHPDARLLRAGVWACLLHEEPELTLEDVSAWFADADLAEVIRLFVKARVLGMPNPAKGGSKKSANPRERAARG